MKNTRKLLALVLTIALIISILCSCSSQSSVVVSEPEAVTDIESVSSVTSEPTVIPEETPAQPESVVEESTVVEIPPVDLPVANHDVTLSMWYEWPPYLDGNSSYSDPNDFPFFQNYSEITGVDFEFTLASMMTASEQFNLLVAAESLPDIVCSINYYTGSLDAAIEEDIFIDMTDMLPKYAPHYLNEIQRDEIWRDVYSQDGRVPVFFEVASKTYTPNTGMFLRQDWLNQVDKDVPTTFDQLYDVLVAFRDEFGGVAHFESDFFFSMGLGLQGDFSNIDGEAVYSVNADNFKLYVEMMNKWYSEGLLFKDYYVYQNNVFQVAQVKQQEVNANRSGLWTCWCEDLTYYGVENPDFIPVAMPSPVLNEGDEIHISSGIDPIVNVDSGWAITPNCAEEKVPIAMQAIDYLYSDEGSILANWGIEGETFTYQDDGTPRYTDLILNNEQFATNMCIGIYCVFRGPLRSDYARFNQNVVGKLAEYCEVWSVQKNDYKMPEVSMDAADSERYTALYSDIDTAIDENLPKFIIGDTPLSELDSFMEQLEQMGLSEMIALQQAALDNYYLREKPIPA